MSKYQEFIRDEELKLCNAGVSDLAFNFEPLCKAMSESELEVTDAVGEAAELFCVCINSVSGIRMYTPYEVINDWLNRV